MEQTTLASSSSVVSLSLSGHRHRHERPIRLKETRPPLGWGKAAAALSVRTAWNGNRVRELRRGEGENQTIKSRTRTMSIDRSTD